VTLTDLGNVYRKRNDVNKALQYYEQAELNFQKNLSTDHPYTAYCSKKSTILMSRFVQKFNQFSFSFNIDSLAYCQSSFNT
jgi:hypothetical protein